MDLNTFYFAHAGITNLNQKFILLAFFVSFQQLEYISVTDILELLIIINFSEFS